MSCWELLTNSTWDPPTPLSHLLRYNAWAKSIKPVVGSSFETALWAQLQGKDESSLYFQVCQYSLKPFDSSQMCVFVPLPHRGDIVSPSVVKRGIE